MCSQNIVPIHTVTYCGCRGLQPYIRSRIWIDSLPLGRSWYKFKNALFITVLQIGIFRSYFALRLMRQDLYNGKSTMVQVMAWCCQPTSHYLAQYYPDLCIHMAPLAHNELTLGNYRRVSNIRRTLVGNKNVGHSDVVGASHVGAAPTTSSFST